MGPLGGFLEFELKLLERGERLVVVHENIKNHLCNIHNRTHSWTEVRQ